MLLLGLSYACKKPAIDLNDNQLNTDVKVESVTDPETAKTIGFFLEKWQPKTFKAPEYSEGVTAGLTLNTVTIDASSVITKIPPQNFGHNANTWMGKMTDTPSFIADVKNLSPQIIRWPAGSGSNSYFWNAAPTPAPNNPNRRRPSEQYMKQWGVPDQLMDKDAKLNDMGYWFGNINENWTASLDDYYETLKQTNSKGSICVNYGFARYGTSKNPVAMAAKLAADWVRYDKGRTEYWEIGNENYADWESGYRIDRKQNQDNQPEFITGDLYAKHFKVFADSMRKAATEMGAKIKIGAVLHESQPASWQVPSTQTWNATLIPELQNQADFYIVHNYVTPYGENSTASVVLNSALTSPKTMIDFASSDIVKYGGMPKPIALTEWNMWAKGSKQQISNTSGTFAVIVQGEAIKNKYGMAVRWDLRNGWDDGNDHGLFSDGGSSDDPRWNARPSFYYMYYFQKTIGDRLIPSTEVGTGTTTTSPIKSYASSYSSGEVAVALTNTSGSPQTVELKFRNFNLGNRFYWYSLEGSNDNGDFSRKVIVNGSAPKGAAGGPTDYATLKAFSAETKKGIKLTVPAWSTIFVIVEKK